MILRAYMASERPCTGLYEYLQGTTDLAPWIIGGTLPPSPIRTIHTPLPKPPEALIQMALFGSISRDFLARGEKSRSALPRYRLTTFRLEIKLFDVVQSKN